MSYKIKKHLVDDVVGPDELEKIEWMEKHGAPPLAGKPAAHSKLGASIAERWMRCPGSVKASAGIEDRPSVHAAEGTAAHELAAKCLEEDGTQVRPLDASKRIGSTFNGFEVTEEMVEAVQVYLDLIREDMKPGDELYVEQRFDLNHIYPGCYGTNDALIYRESEGLLIVYDYKHGRGVPVKAERNKQLMYYALGACTGKHNRVIKTVELVIVQPRCPQKEPVDRWRCTPDELIEFSFDLAEAAKRTETDPALVPGDHCKFCPAAPTCPARRDAALAVAAAEFGDDGMTLSEPKRMTPDELAAALAKVDQVEDWCKSLRDFAHHEAEAGRVATGYKLVPTRPTRVWKDAETARAFLLDYGLDDKDIFAEPKIKTPAAMEKVLGKKSKGDIADLWESVSKGTVLVPLDDKRAPVKPEAAGEFS